MQVRFTVISTILLSLLGIILENFQLFQKKSRFLARFESQKLSLNNKFSTNNSLK